MNQKPNSAKFPLRIKPREVCNCEQALALKESVADLLGMVKAMTADAAFERSATVQHAQELLNMEDEG